MSSNASAMAKKRMDVNGNHVPKDSPMSKERLLLAIPKKGRLFDKCSNILKGAGIRYRRANRLDVAESTNLPVTVVFLPAADIATFVSKGAVDMGITGQDIVQEHEANVIELEQLDFGKCRLSVQAPVSNDAIKSGADLAGKRITTSFPNLTKKHFEKLGVNAPVVTYVRGSVEAACNLGLADAVVDLVETGTTMRAAGLHEVETVMKTQAVLIQNKASRFPKLAERLHRRMKGYLVAQEWRQVIYNCPKDKLAEATKITPGYEGPTVQPLAQEGWVAVSAMVRDKTVSDVMDALEDIGCNGILVTVIANCRP